MGHEGPYVQLRPYGGGREWDADPGAVRGATTAEMAEDLGVAPVTVRRHLGSVERKLGVSTRAQVVDLLSAEANTA